MVLRDGEPVALTRTEFRLLAELAVAEGRILSREDLLDKVWGYGYFGDSGSSTCTSAGCGPRSSATRPVRATW